MSTWSRPWPSDQWSKTRFPYDDGAMTWFCEPTISAIDGAADDVVAFTTIGTPGGEEETWRVRLRAGMVTDDVAVAPPASTAVTMTSR